MCVAKYYSQKKTYENGVDIGANEVAIFVQWYEKIYLNSNELDYRVSRTIITPQVQSNYYLVHAGFAMNEKNGGMNPVQRLRLARHNRHNWHNKEFRYTILDKKFSLSVGLTRSNGQSLQ